MITVYTVCAIVGVVLLVGQLVLTLIGLDSEGAEVADIGDDLEMGDEYVDTHSLSTWFFGVLTFRSIVAAVTFFGLGGRIADGFGLTGVLTFWFALAIGLVAMVMIGWIMQTLYNLRSEGNIQIQNCMGANGSVYLTVPGNGEGVGKVTVSVQERSVEFAAVTSGEPLATGSRVVVTGIRDPNTLEVELDKQTS